MPCSRSAARPSTSSAKSSSPPCVPTFFESASSAASWSSKIIFDSYSRRPISVRLAVVDAAAGDEAQQALVLVRLQIGLDVGGDEIG